LVQGRHHLPVFKRTILELYFSISYISCKSPSLIPFLLLQVVNKLLIKLTSKSKFAAAYEKKKTSVG